jgi:CubicO group peptidase (beta-lactamase class C family)
VDTIAQIGSITKTFTALAVTQLAVEGRVDLKAPVKIYLPDAAEPAASTTLHALMTHTAGLANYCGKDFEARTQQDLLRVCMARPLAHAPGKPVYSNMGFSVAAAVVEHVTGMPWEDYLRERVWQPFGMTRTGWTFPTRARSEFAIGYASDQQQTLVSDRLAALNRDSWNLKGNGGLQASAADMYRFYRGLLAQPPAVREVLMRPHAQTEQPDVMEGYGQFFRLDQQGRPFRVGHSGSDGVFYSYFVMFPQHDAFLYLVGNNGEASVRRALANVLRAVQDAIGVSKLQG